GGTGEAAAGRPRAPPPSRTVKRAEPVWPRGHLRHDVLAGGSERHDADRIAATRLTFREARRVQLGAAEHGGRPQAREVEHPHARLAASTDSVAAITRVIHASTL